MIPFGSLKIDPVELGSSGNAILGIRSSGKTSTATYLAEQLYAAGVPFIAFDPIGVFRYLRVPGKGRGIPVVVAGGESGDLPLTPASAPAIVEAAMQSGVSLVIDLYDIHLSKADWRRIVRDCVRLLLHKNKPHGLRHIFIEEAAEFAPQKVTDGLVYAEMEKLARMGGNAQLGYTLINQRSEEVNKALLELCDNLFLHRQKGRNSLVALGKWLDVGAVKDGKAIIDTLSTLPTGECWAWLAQSERPVHVKVPMKNSLYPSRQTMHGAEGAAIAKAVDVGKFVETLKAALPGIEEKAKADDPAHLRKIIADMNTVLRSRVAPVVDTEALNAEYRRGYGEGQEATARLLDVWSTNKADALKALLADVAARVDEILQQPTLPNAPTPRLPQARAHKVPTERHQAAPLPVNGTGTLQPRLQALLDAIAWWYAAGIEQPTKEQVAGKAGHSPNGGNFRNLLGALSTQGLIHYPDKGRVALSETGRRSVRIPERTTIEELHDAIKAAIEPRHWNILQPLIKAYPSQITRERLGTMTGHEPAGGNFRNLLGALSSLEMIRYPDKGHVKAADWLLEVG